MHDTALLTGELFAKNYGQPGMTVLDLGGQNINGSLRKFFESNNIKFICVDLEEHESVDIVVKPYEKLPFENGTIDIVVSSSCFEHEPCFWITFKELCRVTKLNGYIYINAPSNGFYHKYPGDNWRFYSDAGQALAFWSGKKMFEEEIVNPVKVLETFHVLPINDNWIDFVCIFQRVNEIDNEIIIKKEISDCFGLLRNKLQENNIFTTSKLEFKI